MEKGATWRNNICKVLTEGRECRGHNADGDGGWSVWCRVLLTWTMIVGGCTFHSNTNEVKDGSS